MPMEEGELLSLLKEKFGDSLVERGLGLANGGVRLNKDHRMVRAGGGKMGFKDFGVAAISRSESKVEFDFESLSPQCQSCLLARGTICHHIIATLIAANREAFLSDDDITSMAKSLFGVRDRGSQVARRICPNCGKALDVNAQIVCPKCGRAVCRDCYRKEDGMCSKCYEIKVLGKKPSAGLGDSIKTLWSRVRQGK